MNALTRLAAAALVAVVALGGAIYLVDPNSLGVGGIPGASAAPSVSPSYVEEPPATACRLDLIPTLLMSTNCTYASTVFEHPLTVVSDGSWLVQGEEPAWLSFQGNGHSSVVTLLVLGSVGDADGVVCVPGDTPLPAGETPRSASAYVAWLTTVASGVGSPLEITVGGLPALRLDISAPTGDCQFGSLTLGRTPIGKNGSERMLSCFSGECRLFVIDHGEDVVLIGIDGIIVPPIDPSAAQRAATFVDGLQFVP